MSELYEMEIEQSLFMSEFRGRFQGILRWPELDMFWKKLASRTELSWYVYKIGAVPPLQPSGTDQFIEFIEYINTFLRESHKEKYCGVVYVDDTEKPSFVKIFHPKNLGHGICSINKYTPLPGWTLSTTKPVNIQPPEQPSTGFTRWWNNIVQAF